MQRITYAELHNNNAGEEICETANGKIYSPPRHICCEILPQRIHVQGAHTVSETDRKHTSRFNRVIGFARCHSSGGLPFFIYPCRYCNALRPRFPLNIVRQRLHSFGYVEGREQLIFHSFLSSIDKSLYLALLYFTFFYYMPVFQSSIGDDDKALDW